MPPEPPFSKISISVSGSLAKDYVLILEGPLVAIFLSSYRPRSLLVDRRCQVVMLVAMSFALMPMAPAYPADVSA
jgi:hypothetical protein